jgi:hypothetical protein
MEKVYAFFGHLKYITAIWYVFGHLVILCKFDIFSTILVYCVEKIWQPCFKRRGDAALNRQLKFWLMNKDVHNLVAESFASQTTSPGQIKNGLPKIDNFLVDLCALAFPRNRRNRFKKSPSRQSV